MRSTRDNPQRIGIRRIIFKLRWHKSIETSDFNAWSFKNETHSFSCTKKYTSLPQRLAQVKPLPNLLLLPYALGLGSHFRRYGFLNSSITPSGSGYSSNTGSNVALSASSGSVLYDSSVSKSQVGVEGRVIGLSECAIIAYLTEETTQSQLIAIFLATLIYRVKQYITIRGKKIATDLPWAVWLQREVWEL